MSVSEAFQLPAQPNNAGTVSLRPLGGDGLTAPQSMYIISVAELDGDASAGTATISITLDPQYESLVQVLQFQIVGVAAATDYRMRVRHQGGMSIFNQGQAPFSVDTTARVAWNPSAIINADLIEFVTDNINGDTYRASAVVYNFRKQASELTPLSVLLASLPRAASAL